MIFRLVLIPLHLIFQRLLNSRVDGGHHIGTHLSLEVALHGEGHIHLVVALGCDNAAGAAFQIAVVGRLHPFGAGIGGIKTFEEEIGYYAKNKEAGPKFNPFFIPKMISDISAGQISILYGFHGPNYATTSACATSSNAIADAYNLIRLGMADAIVTGGAEAAITDGGVGGFNAMHAISTRNASPTTASRPFSASRDGFVMGEGAGCLVLEELEHAKARGAKIYAEVAGVGMSADAYHMTAPHPEGEGACRVMKAALDEVKKCAAEAYGKDL